MENFGDQTVFVRREIFSQLADTPSIPPDGRCGNFLRARERCLVAISIRWWCVPPSRHQRPERRPANEHPGMVFILAYKIGVSPHRLHRWKISAPARIVPLIGCLVVLYSLGAMRWVIPTCQRSRCRPEPAMGSAFPLARTYAGA